MRFPTPIPFVEHLGFELLHWADSGAEIAFEPRPELLNSWNVLHGGVTMTLLDVAMAHAARAAPAGAPAESRGVVTVEMKTSFLRPGLGRLVARGRVQHRSTTLAFCEATLHDAAGELVATATGTFKYLKSLPTGGRRLQRLNASD